ncbi:DUF6701 domain-containing protein [Curvibacter delicatus]|uniref:DUF6701 domain-containing protein n=1 Tax=Curvibacter delicatus TaxID=80879 RepID=UPI000836989A|nr:DUF6701 domain-containing protein [Curvibacter delicatus]
MSWLYLALRYCLCRKPGRDMARQGLSILLVLALTWVPLSAHAARTVTSATLNGASSVTVTPGTSITAVVNVTTDGSGSNARWWSTGWYIGTSPPGSVTCVNHTNYSGAGTYSETFSVTAPATTGTYNAYFIAYNDDACSSGASATYTMTSAVVVISGPSPPTATTGAATAVTAWTATLNGTVSSNAATTTVSFQYGLTTAYGETITASQSPLGAGATGAAVSADLESLNCNSTFYYRVAATNSQGTTYGSGGSFTTGACAAPYPATACAATRFGEDLTCSAADIGVSSIALAPGSISSCVSGSNVTVDLDVTINFSSPDRYDVGIFIANDGKLPTLLSASGGASSCSVAVLPTTSPFLDLDGVPQGTTDTCGDGNSSINGGTGSGVRRMTGVTLPCYANATSGGQLYVPYTLSWDSQRSPIGSLCTSNLYPVPKGKSKCNVPASTVAVGVVVLPAISKTDGRSTIAPGANTTYTVVINNNSGGTLQNMVFKDPAVANLTVNSVSCSAANGAVCPSATVSALQGSGVSIPSANLPNNSSLIFTLDATVSGGIALGSHLINTASVSIGTATASASDDNLIALTPAAVKSFAPATITAGASSVLTLTLSNPTASAVTSVAFTDTYPSGLLNTASANPVSTCGGTVTAANNGNTLSLSGGAIPASSSCTVTVNVTAASTGSYLNSTGIISTSAGDIGTASGLLVVNAPVFGAFNACDTAAAPNATCTSSTTVTNSHITTKVAGTSFSLDLVALNAGGNRSTSYNNTVQVQLLDASNNSSALDANNCRSSWTVIATLSPNPSFSPANNGLITVGPFVVAEAYRNVRVRVSNVGGSTAIGCSTDNFAIRPSDFLVVPTDADMATAGTTRSLTNVGATGGVLHKAGQVFTVTLTARNSVGATTANYSGTVVPVVAACSGTACPATLGSFVLGGSGFTAGVLVSNAATYSEVGSFSLTMQDQDFAAVDAPDTAASCAGRYICGTGDVGRFIPDRLTISSPVLTAACTVSSPFTYFGQDGFVTAFTLTAQNASGATTTNYTGTLAKFNLASYTAYGFSAATLPAGTSLMGSATAPSGTWANGVASVSAKHLVTRTSLPVAETLLTVSAAPTDGEVPAGTAVAVGAATTLRYGRLRLFNAYGSERIALPMTWETQYWNGQAFIRHTQDSCTVLGAANIALDNYQSPPKAVPPLLSSSNLSTVTVGAISAGRGTITLAPTAYATGSVDLVVNLGSAGSPSNCAGLSNGSSSSAGLAYLSGQWCGTANDRNPTARASFGVYKSPLIYRRENY